MKRSRSEGKKKADPAPAPNVTINITNYFARASGPTTAKPDDRPPNLFPQEERVLRQPHRNDGTYYLAYSGRDGELLAGCAHCTKSYVKIDTFAPPDCNKNHRKRAAFFEGLSDYKSAYQARDLEAATEARQRVVDNRSLLCHPCQDVKKLSPAVQACKDLYNEARDAACLAQDGCRHPDCVERGPLVVHVLEGDHIDPETKVHQLSEYCWWACNGSVAAMKLEVPKLQWPCSFCHKLEKTSRVGIYNGDMCRRYNFHDFGQFP